MPKIVLYRWRVRDPVTGRWRALRYHASEADVRGQFTECEPITGSRKELDVDPERLTAGHVQRAGATSEAMQSLPTWRSKRHPPSEDIPGVQIRNVPVNDQLRPIAAVQRLLNRLPHPTDRCRNLGSVGVPARRPSALRKVQITKAPHAILQRLRSAPNRPTSEPTPPPQQRDDIAWPKRCLP
jgi:hypothetical protein